MTAKIGGGGDGDGDGAVEHERRSDAALRLEFEENLEGYKVGLRRDIKAVRPMKLEPGEQPDQPI